eukprot:3054935-Rhodomonas_salina.2
MEELTVESARNTHLSLPPFQDLACSLSRTGLTREPDLLLRLLQQYLLEDYHACQRAVAANRPEPNPHSPLAPHVVREQRKAMAHRQQRSSCCPVSTNHSQRKQKQTWQSSPLCPATPSTTHRAGRKCETLTTLFCHTMRGGHEDQDMPPGARRKARELRGAEPVRSANTRIAFCETNVRVQQKRSRYSVVLIEPGTLTMSGRVCPKRGAQEEAKGSRERCCPRPCWIALLC